MLTVALFQELYVTVIRMLNEEMSVAWFHRFALRHGTASSSFLPTRVSEPQPNESGKGILAQSCLETVSVGPSSSHFVPPLWTIVCRSALMYLVTY